MTESDGRSPTFLMAALEGTGVRLAGEIHELGCLDQAYAIASTCLDDVMSKAVARE